MSNNNNKENGVLNSYIDHLSSTSHQFVDGDKDIKNFSLEKKGNPEGERNKQ